MKKELWYYRLIIILALFMIPCSISKSLAQTADSIWFLYVPPNGIETNLPSYEQWLQVYEALNLTPMVYTENRKVNVLYLVLMGRFIDGTYLSEFQQHHVILYNPGTKEIVNAPWGWK